MYKKFNRAIKYNRQHPNPVSFSQKLNKWPISLALSFQPHLPRMAPMKKERREEKGPTCHQPSWQKNTLSTFLAHVGGFARSVPTGHSKKSRGTTKEMGTLGVHIDTRLNNPVWANGIRRYPKLFACTCQKTFTRQTVLWLPMYLSQLSKIYS